MIYAVWQQLNCIQLVKLPVLIDPALLRAARQIYRAYCEAHPNMTKRPTGVAVNQITYRGHIIFSDKPVLLPDEYFVPLGQIEQSDDLFK